MDKHNPRDHFVESAARAVQILLDTYLFRTPLKALTDFAWSRAAEDGLNSVQKIRTDPPEHVVTRGMLRKKK